MKFELPGGKLWHKDHRFESTRQEFQTWVNRVAECFGYSVRFVSVGPEDAVVGTLTQMGIFNSSIVAGGSQESPIVVHSIDRNHRALIMTIF